MEFMELFKSFYASWRDKKFRHDERFGQRLFNEIYKDFETLNFSVINDDYFARRAHYVSEKLWNMSDKDFIEYLERFFS